MEIRNVEDRNSLSIRLTTAGSELPGRIGECYGEIWAYMSRKGIKAIGMPFVLYHNMDMNNLDVDIGWQIEQDDPGEGRIRQMVVTGGEVLYAMHAGPYSALEDTYREVMAYIGENKIKTAEWMYEIYLNSPEDTPEENLKTEIYFPIVSREK